MPTAAPFVGLLYDPAVAGDLQTLTTPPYDQISPEDQERYTRESPFNAVRLELATGANGAATGRYADAAALLSDWRERGVLKEVGGPAVYPYEMDFRGFGADRRVRGVIVEIDLEPYGGSIVPHEGTLPEVTSRLANRPIELPADYPDVRRAVFHEAEALAAR